MDDTPTADGQQVKDAVNDVIDKAQAEMAAGLSRRGGMKKDAGLLVLANALGEIREIVK